MVPRKGSTLSSSAAPGSHPAETGIFTVSAFPPVEFKSLSRPRRIRVSACLISGKRIKTVMRQITSRSQLIFFLYVEIFCNIVNSFSHRLVIVKIQQFINFICNIAVFILNERFQVFVAIFFIRNVIVHGNVVIVLIDNVLDIFNDFIVPTLRKGNLLRRLP